MSYYDEYGYQEEPAYYASEPADYEPEPIYSNPTIYDLDYSSDQHPDVYPDPDVDLDLDFEEPIYYDASIYGYADEPHHNSEALFDESHSEPACSDYVEPLDITDVTQPAEFQHESEFTPIPSPVIHIPDRYHDWNLLNNILEQLEEPTATYNDLPDDEWELAITHDNQRFEACLADAKALMTILSIAEINRQSRESSYCPNSPKQQFSTKSYRKSSWNRSSRRLPSIPEHKPPPPPNIPQIHPRIRPHHKDPPYKQRHTDGPQTKPHRKHPPFFLLAETATPPNNQVNAARRISQKIAQRS